MVSHSKFFRVSKFFDVYFFIEQYNYNRVFHWCDVQHIRVQFFSIFLEVGTIDLFFKLQWLLSALTSFPPFIRDHVVQRPES